MTFVQLTGFTAQLPGAADRYTQHLSASELGAIGEMQSGNIPVPSGSYFARKNRLAQWIAARADNREMVASGARTRLENHERRRQIILEAKARMEATRPSRDQRPKIVPSEARV